MIKIEKIFILTFKLLTETAKQLLLLLIRWTVAVPWALTEEPQKVLQ